MFNHCKSHICNSANYWATASLTLLAMVLFCNNVLAHGSSPKRIALLGDSMTWIGGDSCQNATGWSHYLKLSGLADTIYVYARSGATWTNTSNTKPDPSFYSEILHDDNVVYNQVLRLISDYSDNRIAAPDFIVVFAGANDAWFSSSRPGIFDSDESVLNTRYSSLFKPSYATSLLSSVALSCDLLRQTFPNAYLIAVTPLQMSKVSADEVHKVSDLIEKAAESRDFYVLRADRNVGIRHDVECKTPKNTYDGVHTNLEGARLLSEYIISRIAAKTGIIIAKPDNIKLTTDN